MVVIVGLFYFLFTKLELNAAKNQCDLAMRSQGFLEKKLIELDRETYRVDLMHRKSLNYGISYLSILELIPASYKIVSFKFYRSNRWNIEITLIPDDDVFIDPIPLIKVLKNAQIRDIFVNNQPGKHLRIVL